MYWSTPHTVTGRSPAELFLKRQLRTRFTLLKPHLATTVENKQELQKLHHDKGTLSLRELTPQQQVLGRNFRGGREKWNGATVIKRMGPVTYLIQEGLRRRTVHIDHLLVKRENVLGKPARALEQQTELPLSTEFSLPEVVSQLPATPVVSEEIEPTVPVSTPEGEEPKHANETVEPVVIPRRTPSTSEVAARGTPVR
ncbi:UNVERIFIED_CONTAM: hypothetical protein FKN15_070941 [Acipenser sinensis]